MKNDWNSIKEYCQVGRPFTEEDWNMDSKPVNSFLGYRYSKRVAEEAAWRFGKENNIEITTINPSLVLGPALSQRTDSTSIKMIIELLKGNSKDGAGPMALGCIDVRDVALAHVKAYERPNTSGNRYLITSDNAYTHIDISTILKDIINSDFPDLVPYIDNLPTIFKMEPKFKPAFDTSKIRSQLGIEITPIEISLKDMLSFIVSNNLLQ